jgi:hypothetical protein
MTADTKMTYGEWVEYFDHVIFLSVWCYEQKRRDRCTAKKVADQRLCPPVSGSPYDLLMVMERMKYLLKQHPELEDEIGPEITVRTDGLQVTSIH